MPLKMGRVKKTLFLLALAQREKKMVVRILMAYMNAIVRNVGQPKMLILVRNVTPWCVRNVELRCVLRQPARTGVIRSLQ